MLMDGKRRKEKKRVSNQRKLNYVTANGEEVDQSMIYPTLTQNAG